MLTLHNVTKGTKTLLKWTFILGTILFLFITSYRLLVYIKEQLYPTPPPPPSVSFGKLPSIAFPESPQTKTFSYSLDTITGTLPIFPDRTNVYKIVSFAPRLLALQRAQERIAGVGFTTDGIALSDTLYQWKNDTPPAKTLILDIQSFDFSLTSDYLSNPTVLLSKNLPNESSAISVATSYLSNMSAFPSDIDTERTKTTLLTIAGSQISPATSLSNTQLIQVDFFQKSIDNLPIYYQNPNTSKMTVAVSGGDYQPQVVEVHFSHRDIDMKDSATYPIKSPSEAFEEVKKGKAYSISDLSTNSQISIKNVFLAYFIGTQRQTYLMPIIIFEGTNGYYAYVSAIKEDWIGKEN